MKRTVGALLLPMLSLAACQDTPAICPLPMDVGVFVVVPSLQVAVVDSATGQSLVPGAQGRWIVGTQTDSLRYWNDRLAAFGPTGRYSVAVAAPGYRPWARSDIRVRAGDCGPEMEEVTARLQRE